jgi:branched-chain amino acid transport system permease protein
MLRGTAQRRGLLTVNAQLVAAALITGAIYALMAVSLNLIYGTMRLLNVAHGDFAMIGAYVSYWAFTLWGVPPTLSFIGAMALTGLMGVILYKGLLERVLRGSRSADRVEANSLLVFFGISIVVQNIAALGFSGTPRGYDFGNRIIHFLGVSVAASRLIALLAALLAVAATLLFFRLTVWGLAVRALIQNRDAAALVGIDRGRVFVLSSALGLALAGLTGTLVSMFESTTPFMGSRYTMAAFVIIILGGLGNLTGSVLGGFLLGALETIGISLTGPNYRSILIYGVFIAILLWRPQGLFGGKAAAR